MFLSVLAVSRYDSTSLVFRATDAVDFFNWFWRHRWFNTLSSFDFLLAAMLILAMLCTPPRRRPDFFIPLCTLLVAASVLVRYNKQTFVDTTQDMLFQLRDYAYLAGAYFAASRIRWTLPRYRSIVRMLLILAGLTIILCVVEDLYLPPQHRLWKYGRFMTIRDIADFAFLLFAQFWLVAIASDRAPLPRTRRLLLLAVVAYGFYDALTGVGKAVLVIYPIYLLYLAWQYRLYLRLWFVVPAGLVVLSVACVSAAFLIFRPNVEEGSPLYVYTTFKPDDFSVSTRLSEVRNFSANLDRRGGWLTGIGLGTKWIEYRPQPDDAAAFPAQEFGLGAHLGVHVPLLRLAYDFGPVGLTALLTLFWFRFRRSIRLLHTDRWPPFLRAFVHASWITIGYEIMVNNLAVPKTNLLAGALLGALSGLSASVPATALAAKRGARAFVPPLSGKAGGPSDLPIA